MKSQYFRIREAESIYISLGSQRTTFATLSNYVLIGDDNGLYWRKTGKVFRVPTMRPRTTALEILPLLLQQRSGCGVLMVLHASFCGRCHGSASQHSEVQLGSDVLLQTRQVLSLIVLTVVQESPAHKEKTTRGSFHNIKGLLRHYEFRRTDLLCLLC